MDRKPKQIKVAKGRKYAPKVRLALPFDKAVVGLLGLSPKDAKAVREVGKKKR